MVKEIEKPQLKPTTTRKPMQKAPVLLDVKNDEPGSPEDGFLEPEYAPPRPIDLPFESELLPKGGLVMEGLKKENLYRGFYNQFCNPIDDDGVSKQTKQFNNEIETVMERAITDNAKELDALGWNEADLEPSLKKISPVPDTREAAEAKMARKVRNRPATAQPSGSMSRKAAVALAHSSRSSKPTLAKPTPRVGQTPTRKPLASVVSRRQPAGRGTLAKPSPKSASTTSAGSFVSRNTIGYSKGKSASSAIRPADPSQTHSRGIKSPELEDEADLTITPSRARKAGFGVQASRNRTPQFMSIFDAHDDEELPPMAMPDLGEEEEEFDLQLDG